MLRLIARVHLQKVNQAASRKKKSSFIKDISEFLFCYAFPSVFIKKKYEKSDAFIKDCRITVHSRFAQ